MQEIYEIPRCRAKEKSTILMHLHQEIARGPLVEQIIFVRAHEGDILLN